MSRTNSTRDLTDPELEKVAEQFHLLGEPMRLKILQAICRKPLMVGEIVAATGATQSNVSRHLSLLASAGIITRQKDGQFVYYGMSNPLTMKLCELVRKELLVGSRTGAVSDHRPVSSPRLVKRSVRFSRTALSCLLHAKAYGT